jgi:small subunit ribosomal protein S17
MEKKVTKKIGNIVSTNMQETAVVLVESFTKHPLYQKRVRKTTKFHAHNPEDKYQVGQRVEIAETRPMSKTKHWLIIKEV